jgi:SAM-dependent methyltransferase
MRSAKERAKAEAEFHNMEYREKSRASAYSFYHLIENCSRYYRGYLTAHCGGKQVLEYGCGENSVAPLLVDHGVERFDGVDISEVAVEDARRAPFASEALPGRVQYHVMNAEELRFPDNSFDLVCGIAILHHLDLERAYSEIARVLRPGGSAIFLEPLAHNPAINLYRRMTPNLRTEDEHPLLMRDIGMARKYFGGVETEYFNLFSLGALAFSRTPAFPAARRALQALDKAVFAALPPVRRYAWTTSLVLTEPRT